MNAPDWFLVFDTAEPQHASLCKGRNDALECISWFKEPENLRVHRVTPDELVRDVTDDFIKPEPDEWAGSAWDRSASEGDRLYQERMEGVA
ncbi:MAG: hypothetical protein KF810_17025 [Rhizobiaceae bacterium]|nr:hypothetical protein [Rhizobiaceae bacterium]